MDPFDRDALSRRRFLSLTGSALGAAVLFGACGSDKSSDTTALAAPAETAAADTTAAAAIAETTAAAAATTAAAKELVTVRSQLSWIPNVEFAGYWMGMDKGYFAEEGIKLNYLAGGPNAANSAQVVAADGADIAHCTDFLSLMDAVLAGNDFVLWAVKLQKSPLGFMWLPETGISGPKDLVGKKIGGVQGDQTMIDAVFKANGMEPKYTFVPIGFDPQPLLDKQVDTMTVFVTNQPLTLQVKGIANEKASISEWGLPQYADVMFSKRSYLEANRDTVVRYLTATIKGWEANEADLTRAPQLVIDTYAADQGLSLEQQILNNKAQQPLMQSDVTKAKGLLRISAATMENDMYPSLAAVGRTGLPPVSKLVDETILDDVYGSKIRLT